MNFREVKRASLFKLIFFYKIIIVIKECQLSTFKYIYFLNASLCYESSESTSSSYFQIFVLLLWESVQYLLEVRVEYVRKRMKAEFTRSRRDRYEKYKT